MVHPFAIEFFKVFHAFGSFILLMQRKADKFLYVLHNYRRLCQASESASYLSIIKNFLHWRFVINKTQLKINSNKFRNLLHFLSENSVCRFDPPPPRSGNSQKKTFLYRTTSFLWNSFLYLHRVHTKKKYEREVSFTFYFS